MADEFIDGYIVGSYTNGNNDNGFGAGIAMGIFIFAYPYLPFMIVGYEWFYTLGGGINFIKWGGALLGLILGLIWYQVVFKRIIENALKITDNLLYWIIVYCFASLAFWLLGFVYPRNELVVVVLSIGRSIVAWALKAS